MHVIRMSHYARVLGLAAGMSEAAADTLLDAAPMHDIGKIGIPDRILQKETPLDDAEWDIMKTHTDMGARIIGDEGSDDARFLRGKLAIGQFYLQRVLPRVGDELRERVAGVPVPAAAVLHARDGDLAVLRRGCGREDSAGGEEQGEGDQ